MLLYEQRAPAPSNDILHFKPTLVTVTLLFQKERIVKQKAKSRVSINFQLILIIISSSILLSLITWRSITFTTHEQQPNIKHITPTLYQTLGGSSHTVIVGLYIDQFIDFNMVTNEFTIDCTLWFKFDPGVISLDSLSKFSFMKGTILQKSEPDIQLIENKMLVKYVVRVAFESNLNYKNFPLDSHRIFLLLTNKFVSPSEVIFESSRREFNIDAHVTSEGWTLTDRSVINGYIESSLDPYDPRQDVRYPATLFIFDYTRNSVRYALSIILPLALIFYVLLLANSIRVSVGGITAILAYRFVIENLSPKTGLFMISDYLFFVFLAVCLLMFLLSIVEKKYKVSRKFKMIYISLLHLILIILVTFVVLW